MAAASDKRLELVDATQDVFRLILDHTWDTKPLTPKKTVVVLKVGRVCMCVRACACACMYVCVCVCFLERMLSFIVPPRNLLCILILHPPTLFACACVHACGHALVWM